MRLFLGMVTLGLFAACGGGSGGSAASDAGGGDGTAGDASGSSSGAGGSSSGGSSGAGSSSGGGSGGDASTGDAGPSDGGPSCGPCAPPATCGGGGVPDQCGHPSCTSGQWTNGTVDSFPISIGQTVPLSIAVDSAGGVHVAYSNGGLMYANRAPGQTTWTKEPVSLASVDAGGTIVQDLGIAVDASGTPHVAVVYEEHLVYATRTGPGAWKAEDAFSPINIGASLLVTLDIDPAGAPHVALQFDGPLGDASYVVQAGHLSRPAGGGPWTMEGLAPAANFARPLARVVGNEVHVVFGTPSNQLQDAHRPLGGGSWTIDTMSTTFSEGMTSLAVDPVTGDLHSVYPATDGLHDAHRAASATTWTDDVIVPAGTCVAMSCELGEVGALVIDTWGGFDLSYEAYQYYGSGSYAEELEFATRPRGSTTWSSMELVTPPTNAYAGGYNALAIDRFNGVHLAYLYGTDQNASVMYSYLCP